MEKEYDFSKAEKGRFFKPEAEFHLPVYLDEDIEAFLRNLATEKGLDVQQLVNDWLRANIQLIKSVN